MSRSEKIIQDITDLGYAFRMNDLDDSLEVRCRDGEWQRMSDTLEARIRTNLRDIGYGKPHRPGLSAAKDAYITQADQNRYNAIKSYLASLEGQYDPIASGPLYIPLLAQYFQNPDKQFETWLFKWMTGSVAKIFQGERNPMLVLVAPQHTGKSYFVQWLCPIPHFLKSSINPDNKDTVLRLSDTFIWEVEELGATTRRADIEALKAFITKPFIYERFPYGHYPIHKPVLANFIGTVNFDGAGFLNDPTGSTRFLACEIEAIDFGYTGMDIDKLWSEAYWYFKNVPNCWRLDQADMKRQAEINSQFEVSMALADVIELRLEITRQESDYMTTQEIKNHLAGHHSLTDQYFYNELARVLHKGGLRQKRRPYKPGQPHLTGWPGIKKRTIDADGRS